MILPPLRPHGLACVSSLARLSRLRVLRQCHISSFARSSSETFSEDNGFRHLLMALPALSDTCGACSLLLRSKLLRYSFINSVSASLTPDSTFASVRRLRQSALWCFSPRNLGGSLVRHSLARAAKLMSWNLGAKPGADIGGSRQPLAREAG